MTADTLIAELRSRGVELVAEGDRLRCRPKSALTPADLEELRAHKAEVLARLSPDADRAATKVVCYCCRESRFWRSIHGQVVCGICHPPAHPDLVAEWIPRPDPTPRSEGDPA